MPDYEDVGYLWDAGVIEGERVVRIAGIGGEYYGKSFEGSV